MDMTVLKWGVCWLASLVLAPLLPGIINKTKAFFAGRHGASVFQLYFDLWKLLKKGGVFSNVSGGVLALAPCASLALLLASSLLLPYGRFLSPLMFPGDVIVFFYLLGTARMMTVLAALDTGSSFEGMGASREVQFSALAEAALFGVVCFLFLAMNAGEGLRFFNFTASGSHIVSRLLTAAAFFVVLLAENSRVPVDDPETHLELTMIHEAMILDYAGPDLALILYGAALKLWMFASFLVMILIPVSLRISCFGESGSLTPAVFFLGVLLTGVLLGALESSMARYRFLKVPQLLMGGLGMALLGVFFWIFFE